MSKDAELRSIAERQSGIVSRRQLDDVGLTTFQIRARVEAGVLVKLSHRVFALSGSPDSFERRGRAVLLDSPQGSGLSMTTAAAWYGVPGFELEPIHVSEPREDRSRRTRVESVRHHPTLLPAHHVMVVNGLAVTTPSRTAADLGNLRGLHPKRVERAVDTMWARRLTDRTKLDRMSREWCERGRRGSAFLKAYLAARPAEFRPPESGLERRFIEIVVTAGFPRPRSQVNLGTSEAWFGRTDMLDPELPLIAEIDSDAFHTAPLDVAADEKRDESATRGGFEVERFKEFQIWYEPAEVVDRWREARRRARRAG